ncbi:ABC transporter permease [Citricoccus sp. GCM10030269]|uniref:ABC transporter permease n=1 Tax=Citricoccus sp. GCM10030269 TaxID=3273388 RepID=UPI00360C872A
MRRVRSIPAMVALPIVLVVLWWVVTLGNTNPFIPKPETLMTDLWETWVGPRFFSDVLPSITRLLSGLLIAVIAGIVLGVLIGSNLTVRKLTGPILEFVRSIPPPVLLPVLMMVIGIGDETKVFLIALGCLWPVLLNTVDGVRSADPVLRDTTSSYNIAGLTRLRYFVLPAALPRMVTGIRLSLPIALILMVASEMYAATNGLGFSIIYFQRTFQNGPMWAGVVVLGLVGIIMALLFRWLERRLLSWYYAQRQLESAA